MQDSEIIKQLSEAMLKNHESHWALISRLQNKEPWTGEGLPPVGTVCEWKEKTGFQWVAATVLFITDKSVVLQRSDGFEWQMMTARTVFRTFRTPEQIAAEEREKSANEMSNATQGAKDWMEAFRKLYDAGYRKV